ncbi:hypothetical protein FAGKG844_250044 [Frankia sp. AgKG'84/4]
MDASENSSSLGQKRLGKRVAHLTGDPPFQDDRSTVKRGNKVTLDSRNNLCCRNSQSEHSFRVRREPPRTWNIMIIKDGQNKLATGRKEVKAGVRSATRQRRQYNFLERIFS